MYGERRMGTRPQKSEMYCSNKEWIANTIVGFLCGSDTASIKQKGSVMLKQLDHLKKCTHMILPTVMIL